MLTTRGASQRVFLFPRKGSLYRNLVAYWKLDEASGTRFDATGRGNDLTDNNTVTQTAGKIGNAAQFTAANSEYLSRADCADLSMTDIDFTIACWVKADSIPNDNVGIITKDRFSAVAKREWTLYNNAAGGASPRFNLAVFGAADGSVGATVIASTFGVVPTGAWCFICAWHDSVANTLNIQVNNGAVDSVSYSGGCNDGSAAFAIGAHNETQRYWDGAIDEAGIWKRVLTAAERNTLALAKGWPF